MKLEGGERLVLRTLLDLQGPAVDYVEDARLASAAKMYVQDVRDWLETLEGKGFVERSRGTAGFSAYVTARGRQALRLMEPISSISPAGPYVNPADHPAGPAVDPSPASPTLRTTVGSVDVAPVQTPDSTASGAIESPGSAAVPDSSPTGNLELAPVTSGPPSQGNYQIVLLIHGIRTQAEWQAMVREKIEVPGKVEVIPIKYGYFDALRFWFPFWTRRKPVEHVYTQIRVALQKTRKTHPEARLSIIAHSFGTFLIGEILRRGFDLQVHRLILCGCVLPEVFPWHQIQGRFDEDKVVNECGKGDIWPVLAKSLSWGYGASGTHGFGAVLVKDRFHAGGHGQYFEPAFVEKYWEPFIRRGEYKPTEFEVKMPPTPWWISLLGAAPIRWILVLMAVIAILAATMEIVGRYGDRFAASSIAEPCSLKVCTKSQNTLGRQGRDLGRDPRSRPTGDPIIGAAREPASPSAFPG